MVSEDVFCDQFLRFGITSSLAEWWWQAGRSEPAESSAGIECSTREHAQTLQIARRSVGPEQTTVSQRAKSEKPLSRHYNSSVLLENFFLPFFFLAFSGLGFDDTFHSEPDNFPANCTGYHQFEKKKEWKEKRERAKGERKRGGNRALATFLSPFPEKIPRSFNLCSLFWLSIILTETFSKHCLSTTRSTCYRVFLTR